jgi:hypothetical protein
MKENFFLNTAPGFYEVKLRTSQKPKVRLERLDGDKHSCLFGPFVSYGEKSFLNTAPGFCEVKLRTSRKPKT